MTKSGKTPDEKQFMVRRPLLPAAFWSNAAKKSTEHSDSSTASPLAQVLFKALLFLVLGIVLVPLSLIFRIAFRHWTVERCRRLGRAPLACPQPRVGRQGRRGSHGSAQPGRVSAGSAVPGSDASELGTRAAG